jgi:L-ascorbate metabolism protein UlaG (beta-lactamase superfamily)
MKIAYYGHASFTAKINGKHLLFDPFITQNPLAKAVDIIKNKANYILVSHAHFDHITDTAAIADQTGATVISDYEVISRLGKNGVKNTRPLNPGGTYSSDFAGRNVSMPFIPVPCPMVLMAAAPAVSWSSPRMPIFITPAIRPSRWL